METKIVKKILALAVILSCNYASNADAYCQFGSVNYQQCLYNEQMANTGVGQQQTVTSHSNLQGGFDYSNGVTSRTNPQRGYDYSNGVTCQRNPSGGLDCRHN